ncbi:MAG: 4Fe-4S dicluster domain-containing protein [Desulfobacterales bacterium]
MIKRSFIGLIKPRMMYQAIELTSPEAEKMPVPKQVTLLLNEPYDSFGRKQSVQLKKGDPVKTGQKLAPYEDSDAYVVSSVTGTISALSAFIGDFGRSYTAISIDAGENEEIDEQFSGLAKDPTLETVKNFLAFIPGNLPKILLSPDQLSTPIETIVICGVDRDLLITANQHTVAKESKSVKRGVQILKKVTGIENIIITSPENLMQDAGLSGAEVRVVNSAYPASLPHLIMRDLLGQVVPAGKSCEDLGVAFISAEAVASLGRAFNEGRIPVYKRFNLVKKDGASALVSARIGTPIRDIFSTFDISAGEKDRIIFGGPMTGEAIYSEDHPIQPDTDAVMIQDHKSLALVSDYPCINCSECIPICPAKIPVNMLVRFLEVGKYQEAVDEYDLYSCIECGLCSFVCVSRIPILQYIKLAKYELGRISRAEETNV